MKHNAITLCPVCVLFPREVEQAVIRRAGSSDIQIGTVSNTNGQMQERIHDRRIHDNAPQFGVDVIPLSDICRTDTVFDQLVDLLPLEGA